MVPRLAFEDGRLGELAEPRRRCLDEGKLAVFREDNEKILIGEQEHLAVAIAATLPHALVVVEVDAARMRASKP